MIRFDNLTKGFWVNGQYQPVIDNMSMTVPSGISLALLGRNGAGKSTLLQLIAGTLQPDRGRLTVDGTVSWPVGFGKSFHRDLTGAQNVRFVARIYGVDTESLLEFVQAFSELGDHFHMPVRSYSSGMRARLAFGTSMGIRFDTYLVDEVTAVGDGAFRRKSRAVFRDRMRHAGAIVVNHNMGQIRNFCDAGLVLDRGQLHLFDDIEDAIEAHQEIQARSA